MRRTLPVILLAIAGVGVGLTGCGVLNQQTFNDSRSENNRITEVRIEGDSGRVTLKKSGTVAQIERAVHYEDKKPSQRFDTVQNGVLTLNTECAKRGCDIDYTVSLPDSVRVTGRLDSGRLDASDIASATLTTDSGRISVSGATGDLTATTDSGSISVSRVTGSVTLKSESGKLSVSRAGGPVVLQSDSGAISADGLTGPQTTARTEAGSVSINAAALQDIKVETDSGKASVTVPSGGTWRLQHNTDAGSYDSNLANTPNGAHMIDVKTSSGSIEINQSSDTPASHMPSTSTTSSTTSAATSPAPASPAPASPAPASPAPTSPAAS
jgi:DUF4097 and DUF4098 domain-containing protein YvlB